MRSRSYDRRTRLIRDHDVVRSEAPTIDGILIIRLTFIVSRVLLRRRINLHFRLYRVVADGPLVHLEKFVMVHLNPILQPSDFRPRETGGHAEERDLPAQHVIQFKVRCFHDLSTIFVLVIMRAGGIPIRYQDGHPRAPYSSSVATSPSSTSAALLRFCAHH